MVRLLALAVALVAVGCSGTEIEPFRTHPDAGAEPEARPDASAPTKLAGDPCAPRECTVLDFTYGGGGCSGSCCNTDSGCRDARNNFICSRTAERHISCADLGGQIADGKCAAYRTCRGGVTDACSCNSGEPRPCVCR